MKSKNLVFTLLALFFSAISYSQTTASFAHNQNRDNPNRFRKNSVSYNMSGTTQHLGLTYERIFARWGSVEAGIGVLSVGVGLKVYMLKMKNNEINYHTGITTLYCADPLANSTVKNYLPIGITYLWDIGLLCAGDIGPITSFDLSTKSRNFKMYGNLKIGWRF